MQLPKTFQKYLSKQNLTKWNIELSEEKYYNNIIIVPAIDETKNIPKLLNSLLLNSEKYLTDTLILVVVNNIKGEKKYIIDENEKLINYLREIQRIENFPLNIGLIDTSSKGKELPTKEGGVGLARKIGMDLALNYLNYRSDKKKIIISLDADCTVTNNYLEEIITNFNDKNFHAAVVNFEHTLPESNFEKAAIINYEIFIRYYVLGLKYAKSAFAYYSVGSTIICDAESYVKVGGMNNRKAGEDFYFLEKLAKLNKINKIDSATVFPLARVSSRVPFGTGQRVQRFINQTKNEYLLYAPITFEILKQWLEIYNNEEKSQTFSKSWTFEKLQKAKEINPLLYEFLIRQNFEEDWLKILSNSKTTKQIGKQKLMWMDGFRTLKLLHYLRDNKYKMINTFEAVNQLLKMYNVNINFKTDEEIPSLKIQLQYLKILRKLT